MAITAMFDPITARSEIASFQNGIGMSRMISAARVIVRAIQIQALARTSVRIDWRSKAPNCPRTGCRVMSTILRCSLFHVEHWGGPMTQRERRLGKGLDSLIGGGSAALPEVAVATPGQPDQHGIDRVALDRIDPNPWQPRR